jgi:D-3-phosphoglycerate dehydrogenase / 2-oxoglutarate reductase
MKILIISPIDSGAVAALERRHDVVCAIDAGEETTRRLIQDREALIFRSGVAVSGELMRRAPGLRLLVRGGSGFDNVDMDYVKTRGIEFRRIPEPGARAVAELTFALMLALARNIMPADAAWRQGRWLKHELPGYLLRGKVLGIVGAGSIGRTVGELGAAWGMDVLGCVGHPTPAVGQALLAHGIRLASFDEVVSNADFLCVHVALTPATRNLIDSTVLGRMKPGSFLLNLARGGVVDETALRAALLRGDRVVGAGLDVHEAEGAGRISQLADLPNVILTPHIGATTVDTQREIGERIVAIVEEFATGTSTPRRSPAPDHSTRGSAGAT